MFNTYASHDASCETFCTNHILPVPVSTSAMIWALKGLSGIDVEIAIRMGFGAHAQNSETGLLFLFSFSRERCRWRVPLFLHASKAALQMPMIYSLPRSQSSLGVKAKRRS